MDAQDLARMAPERRYPILGATAVERLIATSDLVLDLFDTAVGAIDRKARRAIAMNRPRHMWLQRATRCRCSLG